MSAALHPFLSHYEQLTQPAYAHHYSAVVTTLTQDAVDMPMRSSACHIGLSVPTTCCSGNVGVSVPKAASQQRFPARLDQTTGQTLSARIVSGNQDIYKQIPWEHARCPQPV